MSATVIPARGTRFLAGVCLSLACAPAAVLAAESQPTPGVPGASLIQVTLGLVLVLVLIITAAWVLRRVVQFNVPAGALKVLGGLSMGARERVVLLQVGKEQLLIGVAPGQIRTLHVLQEPVEASPAHGHAGGFAARLREVLGQGGTRRDQGGAST
jgi:flagellar protein FliO/FliZ